MGHSCLQIQCCCCVAIIVVGTIFANIVPVQQSWHTEIPTQGGQFELIDYPHMKVSLPPSSKLSEKVKVQTTPAALVHV